MKTHEDVSINEVENWGGLKSPRDHVAAVGARIIDNRSRNLDVVYNRVRKELRGSVSCHE